MTRQSATGPVIFLLGPTAVGKTSLALALGERFHLEVISVDSGSVYRGMDVGTAKPSPAERLRLVHHLIDIRAPHEVYSAADFVADGRRLIAEIHARGAVPMLTGGTMLYYNAIERGLSELPPANAAVRRRIAEDAGRRGWHALHEELERVDPASARRIHPNDPQRLQRALEVYALTGKAMSQLQRESATWRLQPTVKLALFPSDRAWLHARIEQRVESMLRDGLIDEVRRLKADQRLTADTPSMRSVGYRQVWGYLAGDCDRTTMIMRTVAATRQLAKRQLTWMRSMESLVALPCNARQARVQAEAVLDSAGLPMISAT